MGMDGVELVMAVEDAFQITISDDEASQILTVGQLYSCVLEKLGNNPSQKCLSSVAFYRVRRALINLFEVSRASVTPTSKLSDLLPSNHRRLNWQRLSQAVALRLPDLVRPVWVEIFIVGTFFSCIVLGILMALLKKYAWYLPSALLIGSIPFCWAAYKLTTPCAVHIPRDCVMVRGTVEAILRLNYGKIAKREQQWNKKEVWETLRAVIVAQLGVNPDEVKAEAKFVDDLKVD